MNKMRDNKNTISVKLAAAVGIGAIIGAGIFVLSGTAIAIAGSYALLAFVFVGVLATIMALQLGELASIMPNVKGATYSYIFNAFGSEMGFITGILIYFSLATGASAIALGFGSYLAALLGLSTASSLPIIFAALMIFVLAVVNIIGIKKAAQADSMLVIIKLAILSIFIIAAIVFAFKAGTLQTANFVSLKSQSTIAALFLASIAVVFAYSGTQSVASLTPRVKGKGRGAAKAMIIAVSVSIAFYILIVAALLTAVPASKFTISADPLTFALNYIHAPYALFLLVGIGALIATVSATLATILTASRSLYQISEDKLLPKFIRKYNKKRDVAINGVIISAVIGVVMLFSGNIFIIAAISNFGLLFAYLMASFSVIHFRRLKVDMSKPNMFGMPLYPYLSIIAIVLLILFIAAMPAESLMIGVIMIIMLFAIYYFLREFSEKKPVKVKLFK